MTGGIRPGVAGAPPAVPDPGALVTVTLPRRDWVKLIGWINAEYGSPARQIPWLTLTIAILEDAAGRETNAGNPG